METKETRVYKGKQYTVVDKYECASRFIHDGTDIAILERNGKYFIQNYEGMDLFIGPFDDARKTGDNGEILVKDVGKDFYYVPGIKKEKPMGIGFLKEYHPEYHYAEPYVYDKRLKAAAKTTDGTIRIKHSTGYLEDERLRYYYDNGIVEIREDLDGRARASSYDLELPLEFIARPDDPNYPVSEVPSFAVVEAYGKYRAGQMTLEELPYSAFLNDKFLMKVLEVEKTNVKNQIIRDADKARSILGDFASVEDLDQMAEVDIDEKLIQEKLNSIAAVVVGKRRVAVQEVERLAAIEKKERNTTRKVESALDFDSIVKKSNVKPRKKPAPKGDPGIAAGPMEGVLGSERGE
jgi:hypothetical protein